MKNQLKKIMLMLKSTAIIMLITNLSINRYFARIIRRAQ